MRKIGGLGAIGVIVAILGSPPSLAQLPPIKAIPAPPQPDGAIALPAESSRRPKTSESWIDLGGQPFLRNVSVPTLTPFVPIQGTSNGVGVIVVPGGAYKMLAMEREGWNIAHWLTERGFAAFVLKYRLDPTPADVDAFSAQLMSTLSAVMSGSASSETDGGLKPHPEAVADAVAAIRMVRTRALEWGIDPHRVGVMGFSAGAMTALGLVALDAAGAQPDFVAAIYPPMQTVSTPAGAPPLFAALASDDPLFGGKGFGLIEGWQQSRHPVEFHLYERGSHGFGMGAPGTTSLHWLDEFQWWLQMRGLSRARD